jgi:hypothetical protein
MNNFGENQISLQIKMPKVEKIWRLWTFGVQATMFKLIFLKTTLLALFIL